MSSRRLDPELRGSQWLSAIALTLALFACLIAILSLDPKQPNVPLELEHSTDWQILDKTDIPTESIPFITRLTVISVNRSEPLLNLVDWCVVDLNELPPIKILIQATRAVQSVVVQLDGTVLGVRNGFPMFVTDQLSLALPNGTHWVSVIPFSQPNGDGMAGPEFKLSFIVVNGNDYSPVQGVVLYPDTVSSQLISPNEAGISAVVEVPISQPQFTIPMRISAIPRPNFRFQAFIDSTAISLNDFPFDFTLQSSNLGLHSVVVVPNQQTIGKPDHFTFFIDVVKSPFYPAQIVYPEVTNFILYDAQLSEDVNLITEGFIMNSNDVSTHVLIPTIRVNTDPELVGSVQFQLDGIVFAIANTFPYQIGNTKFDLQPGTYNLSAIAFSLPNAEGNAGTTRHVIVTFE